MVEQSGRVPLRSACTSTSPPTPTTARAAPGCRVVELPDVTEVDLRFAEHHLDRDHDVVRCDALIFFKRRHRRLMAETPR